MLIWWSFLFLFRIYLSFLHAYKQKITIFWMQHLILSVYVLPLSPCGWGWVLLGSLEMIVCNHPFDSPPQAMGWDWKFTARPLLPWFQGCAVSELRTRLPLLPLSPNQNFQSSVWKKNTLSAWRLQQRKVHSGSLLSLLYMGDVGFHRTSCGGILVAPSSLQVRPWEHQCHLLCADAFLTLDLL